MAERGNIPSICILCTSFPFNLLILLLPALVHMVASFLFVFFVCFFINPPPPPNNHKTNAKTPEARVHPPGPEAPVSIRKSLSQHYNMPLPFFSFSYPKMTPSICSHGAFLELAGSRAWAAVAACSAYTRRAGPSQETHITVTGILMS